MYENYKNLEQRLFRKKATLTLKMPELQKAFDAVSLLIERREAQEEVRAGSLAVRMIWTAHRSASTSCAADMQLFEFSRLICMHDDEML